MERQECNDFLGEVDLGLQPALFSMEPCGPRISGVTGPEQHQILSCIKLLAQVADGRLHNFLQRFNILTGGKLVSIIWFKKKERISKLQIFGLRFENVLTSRGVGMREMKTEPQMT